MRVLLSIIMFLSNQNAACETALKKARALAAQCSELEVLCKDGDAAACKAADPVCNAAERAAWVAQLVCFSGS